MDALRAIAPLARVMLSLSETRRSGALRVRSRSRAATLWLIDGRLTAVDGVDGKLLGDALLERGVLDQHRHGSALASHPPSGRIGDWLIEVGAASPQDVSAALKAQLHDRIATLLRWPAPTHSFSQDLLRGEDEGLRVDLTLAVWDGLLMLARSLPEEDLGSLSGISPLRLTNLGESLSAALLRTGRLDVVQRDELLRAGQTPRPERAVLRVLDAATDPRIDSESYTLLLRKQRQLRRSAGPLELLDLPEAARSPEAAKRALKKLVRQIHPDRFAAAEPRLRAVSSEVLRALLDAEQSLRVIG